MLGYIFTLLADKTVIFSAQQANINKIIFQNTPALGKKKLSSLPDDFDIRFTQHQGYLSLETEKPIQEFIDLLRRLEFFDEEVYVEIQEKIKLPPAMILESKAVDEELKPHIVTDYSEQPIPYVAYSIIERCFRFVVALLTFPISVFRIHLINEGEIGLVFRSGIPEILPSGWHVMLAPSTTFVGRKKIDAPYIQHGTIQLIRIQEGQLGYVKDKAQGKHLFLQPGFHLIRSATTQFIKFLDLKREINELDPGWLIYIKTGKEGLVYDEKGELVIKKPGIHLIIPPARLETIISTQDSIMELEECVYDSCDYVPLKIKADVFYRITETEKVCQKIASENLSQYIHDIAIATLSGIIRNSSFKEIGQSSTPAYHSVPSSSPHQEANESSPSLPPYSFYSKVHDAFIKELQHHGIHKLGIDIFNIRIESLKIQDQELAKNIYSQALLPVQIQVKLANVEAESQIRKTEAEQKALTQRIQAEANATAIKIEAEAQAEAMKRQAEAEADAIQVRGKAKNQVLIENFQALAEGGRLVNDNPTSQKAMLASVNPEQFNNIQKIIYLPSALLEEPGIAGLLNLGIFQQNNKSSDLALHSDSSLISEQASFVPLNK